MHFQRTAKRPCDFLFAFLYSADGGNLGGYVKGLCLNSENVYVKLVGSGKDIPEYLHQSLLAELDILQEVAELDKTKLCASLEYPAFLPDFTTEKLNLKELYLRRAENIGKYGYGIYAQN